MSISIRGSVGVKGNNQPADVIAIQRQLNGLMNAPRVPLTVDGRCGPKTCTMIADFQCAMLGLTRPDARVDPNGRTLATLNDPGSESKWARMSIAPAPAVAAGSGNLTALEQQRLKGLYDAAASISDSGPANDFLAYVSENEVSTLKTLLNVQGASQYAVEFIMGIANMRRAGFTAREITFLFSEASKLGPGRIDNAISAMRLVGKSGKLAGTLKAIGNIATVLQILATATIAIDHFRAGRIGPGFAEIYGTAMGIAIPVAGFLNAVQELLYAANPSIKNDSRFNAAFRFLLACEPIGAGKTAVDTCFTFYKMGTDALFKGKINPNDVDELVKRMRNSPMRFWTEIGDSTGDWLGDHFGEWYYNHFLK